MRLNFPCVAAMQSFVKLLSPLLINIDNWPALQLDPAGWWGLCPDTHNKAETQGEEDALPRRL